MEAEVQRAFLGRCCCHIVGFPLDCILAVNEAGGRSKAGAQDVESVSNGIVEWGFADALALEKVVALRIKWVLIALGALHVSEAGWEAGQAEFALHCALEDIIGEAVVGAGSVVVGQGEAGVCGEEGGEGILEVWWCCCYECVEVGGAGFVVEG